MTAALVTTYAMLIAAVAALAVYEHTDRARLAHRIAATAFWALLVGSGVELVVALYLLR